MTHLDPRRDTARAVIAGCPIDHLTMDRAVAWCLGTCAGQGPARILLTANASHLVAMADDAALRQAAQAADLVTADGMSLVWASRLLGAPLPERVAGVDLMALLLERAAEQGLGVYFLGARPEVVRALVAQCERRYPGLRIAGWRDGFFGREDDEAVLRRIAGSGADILFVGMPSPFKDIWCERHRDRFGVRLVIGVGGSFDVLAGFIQRAPGWMRGAGLEWAWRLLLEPRRLWRRYLVGNSRFIGMVLRQRVRGTPG